MKINISRTKRVGSALALAAALLVTAGAKVNADLVYGVNDQLGELVSFNSTTPGSLLSAHAISGMQPGEQLRGIDWIGNTLYGLGDQSHLYTINPNTAAATPVGAAFTPILDGVDFGFTAGPSQLYVCSDLGQNETINPSTASATALPNYTGAALDAMTYDPLNGLFYGISADTEDVYLVNPATGAASLVGPTGVDFADEIGFDIAPSTGSAYFSGTVDGQTEFFTVNLATAALTLVGDVGTPGDLTSGLQAIAVAPVPEPATTGLFVIGGGMALNMRRRKR